MHRGWRRARARAREGGGRRARAAAEGLRGADCLFQVCAGVGVRISKAVIQGCSDCGVPIDEDEDFRRAQRHGARLYKVWGTDRCGPRFPLHFQSLPRPNMTSLVRAVHAPHASTFTGRVEAGLRLASTCHSCVQLAS